MQTCVILVWETAYSETRQIQPKRQRWWTSRLTQQYVGLLKSWIKGRINALQLWMERSFKTTNYRRKRNARGTQLQHWHQNSSRMPRLAAMCMKSATEMHAAGNDQPRSMRPDTDSFRIGIDNHASRCITNSISDCVDVPRRVRGRVKGLVGQAAF